MDTLELSTAENVLLFMQNSGSGVSGLTLSVEIAKEDTSFSAISPTIIEKGYGWYMVQLTSDDTDTLGSLIVHAEAVGAEDTDREFKVIQNTEDALSQSVWTYTQRTLTTSNMSTYEAGVYEVLCKRGDNFNLVISQLGDISDNDSLYFTVKNYYRNLDDESVLQIAKRTSGSSGLLYLNGASASAISTSASIVVEDAYDGVVRVLVDPIATQELPIKTGYLYDLQMITTSGSVITIASGEFTVIGDVTRAIT